jgi:hypothetical protein
VTPEDWAALRAFAEAFGGAVADGPSHHGGEGMSEQYIVARLDTSNAGQRIWHPFEVVDSVDAARERYRAAADTYGDGDIRLEKHTIEVLDGPEQ